jgi:hypothetical protein
LEEEAINKGEQDQVNFTVLDAENIVLTSGVVETDNNNNDPLSKNSTFMHYNGGIPIFTIVIWQEQ